MKEKKKLGYRLRTGGGEPAKGRQLGKNMCWFLSSNQTTFVGWKMLGLSVWFLSPHHMSSLTGLWPRVATERSNDPTLSFLEVSASLSTSVSGTAFGDVSEGFEEH